MRMFTWCLQISWGSILAFENVCMMNSITVIYRVSALELSLSVSVSEYEYAQFRDGIILNSLQ